MNEVLAPPCPICGGDGNFLGKLGCSTLWFRCRACGIDFVREPEDEEEDEDYDDDEEFYDEEYGGESEVDE